MADVPNGNGDAQRRGIVRFDPTINVGHIGTILAVVVSITVSYMTLANRIDQQSINTARIEKEIERTNGERKEDRKSIEASFLDKVNDQKALIQNVSLNTSANIAEIKAALVRIEEKLDRKADKPGR